MKKSLNILYLVAGIAMMVSGIIKIVGALG